MSKQLYALISIYREGATLTASLPDLNISASGGTVQTALVRLGEKLAAAYHWRFNAGWGVDEEVDDKSTDNRLDQLMEDGKL